MAKAAIVEDEDVLIVPQPNGRLVSPGDAPYVDPYDVKKAETRSDEVRSIVEEGFAPDSDAPTNPTQPYVRDSWALKADMLKREAVLNSDIAMLEGQRDGMNARIDDMNYTRNAIQAALATLK